jgi:hypothetical protein
MSYYNSQPATVSAATSSIGKPNAATGGIHASSVAVVQQSFGDNANNNLTIGGQKQ